jgi:DNA helicase II / ATP-dependent DNA helicase PcrA
VDLEKELNPIQAEAAKATEGPVLILAGAGSGKTRCLMYRIAYLIEERGVDPSNVLCVTFTNKSANEMKERIHELTGQTLPWMGTFHSISSRILRKEGYNIGIEQGFVIYDTSDQEALIKEICGRLNIDVKNFNPRSILGAISSAKNELMDPGEYNRLARGLFQETAAKVYSEYKKSLTDNNALDFDDLLMRVVELFEQSPEVLERYQQQFQYILIDEYQDTNRAQYRLVKMLGEKYKNICVVGDASQSIYSFRGADFRNIVSFERDYPDSKVFNLEQNYRSTKNILDAAHAVISKNRSHPILKLWTENDGGTNTIVYEARDEVDEAKFIIRMVEKYQTLWYGMRDFAVLYRTNAQSRVLEEEFLRAGLPYRLVGGTRFYERKEIKDMLAYLRILANPKDKVSFKRVVNVPPRGIGPAQLKTNGPKVSGFEEVLQELRMKAEERTTIEIMDLVNGLTGYLRWLDDGTPEAAARVENVKELRSVASEFPDLQNFLENVALVEQEQMPDRNVEDRNNAVTLMTMHAAKGLEFPVVFLVGLEEGIFPHSRALMDMGEMEEERRLAYVGITRAKKQLFLTYARQRLFFGSRTAGTVSRFIVDIPEDLLIPIRL